MKELLKEMEAYAAENRVPVINAAGREVLVKAAQACKAERVLEIGTAIGYSTLLLAQNSVPGVSITTLELDEVRAETAQAFIDRSPYREQIRIVRGDAAENIKSLRGLYDLVFIDAAKGQYPEYFRLILPILAPQAAVIADNVLFRGYVCSEEKPPRRYKTIVKRLREYIALVETQPDFVTKIYQDGDGLAVSTRRIDIEET